MPVDRCSRTESIGRRPAAWLAAGGRRRGFSALALAGVLSLGFVPAAARAGYGPSVLQPSEVPGGYSQVVTASTIGKSGALLRGAMGGTDVKIQVPAGAFTRSIQLRILKPHLPTLLTAIRKWATATRTSLPLSAWARRTRTVKE